MTHLPFSVEVEHSKPESLRVWHDGLDVLRGIAALSVVLFHCIGLLPWNVEGTPLVIFSAGWIGVDLFFMISGYVICASALRLKSKLNYAQAFWRARLTRIVPLYVVTSVLFVALVDPAFLRERPVLQLLSHLFFVHNLFPETALSLNGVTWSLGVEMQFYLLAFLCVPSLARIRYGWLIPSYLLLLLGVLGYRYGAWHWLRSINASEAMISHALSQVPALLDSFALGALMRLFGIPSPNRTRSMVFALLALAIFALIYLVYANYSTRYWSLWPMAVLLRSLIALCAACALQAALYARHQFNHAWRPAIRLGQLSYGIYLWHLIVLQLVQKHTPLTGTKAVLMILLLTWLLSELSLKLVERPAMSWGRMPAKPNA